MTLCDASTLGLLSIVKEVVDPDRIPHVLKAHCSRNLLIGDLVLNVRKIKRDSHLKTVSAGRVSCSKVCGYFLETNFEGLLFGSVEGQTILSR